MKYPYFISAVVFVFLAGGTMQAQILKKLTQKFDQKFNEKVDQLGNKIIDKTFGIAENTVDKVDNKKSKKKQNRVEQQVETEEIQAQTSLAEEVNYFFADDFSSSLGTFPKGWGTNIGGEVVTLSTQEGLWLRIADNTIVYPKLENTLPQNFSIDFDLVYPASGLRPPVTFGFSEMKNPSKMKLQKIDVLYFIIPASVTQSVGYSNNLYSGYETFVQWNVDNNVDQLLPVSIKVEDTRIQLFINGKKMFDLPDGFDKNSYRNNFHFRAASILPPPKDAFYVSNFRITEN